MFHTEFMQNPVFSASVMVPSHRICIYGGFHAIFSRLFRAYLADLFR